LTTTPPLPITAVLGAGAFGTALARHLALSGETVRLWCRSPEQAALLRLSGRNERYLPEVPLPPQVVITSVLAEALAVASTVVLAAPAQFTRAVALRAAPLVSRTALVVCAAKGIELESLATLDVVLQQALPLHPVANLAYLSGPSFASELAQGAPSALVVASTSAPRVDVPGGERWEVAAGGASAAHHAQRLLSRARLRVYTSADVRGVLVGGALKNVIALAVGAADGLGLGHNGRAALVTRGLAEMARLATRLGGEPRTLSGLAGLGDLILTCHGPQSRNRQVGLELGRGGTLEQLLWERSSVAEGVDTCRAAWQLAQSLGVSMPIVEQVYEVLFRGRAVADAVAELFSRELRGEQDELGP
jgi:glycerol-3-phosphate dehydrogenase (NAD(P)+)